MSNVKSRPMAAATSATARASPDSRPSRAATTDCTRGESDASLPGPPPDSMRPRSMMNSG
jgi:hypothetical protein